MSYIKTHNALGLTRAQQTTLVESVTVEELEALPVQERLGLVLRRQEVKAAESSARWSALSTFVVVAVPIAAFFGISLRSKK
jgi:hypothetical protein